MADTGFVGEHDDAKSRPNQFETGLSDLSSEQRRFADTTLNAAKATFAKFEDSKESHYYCAPESTPSETWQAVTVQVARVTAILAAEAAAGRDLALGDIDEIHRGIFGPVFGEDTLRMRRFEEQVEYGIVLGPRGNPQLMKQYGKSGRSLGQSLGSNLRDLAESFRARDRAIERGQPRTVVDATRPAARAYGRFLADHPYFDGNGRTGFPILSFALIRLGLVAVAIPETRDFHWCLGRAMQRSHRDPEPLAVYLKELILASDTSREA